MTRTLRGFAIACACLLAWTTLVNQAVASKKPSCFGRSATIVGHKNQTKIKGTPHADVIVGTDANDQIKGGGGNDRICGGEGDDFIYGGVGNDKINGQGDSGFGDTLFGDSGSDLVKGGAAPSPDSPVDHNDLASFLDSATGVTADLNTGNATGEGNDRLVNIEQLEGSQHDDTFTTDLDSNFVIGHDGDDTIDVTQGNFVTVVPGEGDDAVTGAPGNRYQAVYDDTAGPVSIDLTAGTVTGAGNDTLHNFSDVIGTRANDTILGTTGPNQISGCSGNDTIDLKGNSADPSDPYGADPLTWDIAFGDDCFFTQSIPGNDDITGGSGGSLSCYCAATSGVTVDLTAGTVSGGGGTDTLHSLRGVIGSNFDDTLKGSGGPDLFEGSVGHDTIDGRGGEDVFEGFFSQGLTVDLGAGTASGNFPGAVNGVFDFYPSTATLMSIEDVWGSLDGPDSLTGDNQTNRLFGIGGNDALYGMNGNDYLDGSDGTDSSDGGNGTDTCISVESPTSCESSTPARAAVPTSAGTHRPSYMSRPWGVLRARTSKK